MLLFSRENVMTTTLNVIAIGVAAAPAGAVYWLAPRTWSGDRRGLVTGVAWLAGLALVYAVVLPLLGLEPNWSLYD